MNSYFLKNLSFLSTVDSYFKFPTMWSNLPFDVLAHIFSFLPSDSLARAMSSCHHWHDCVKSTGLSEMRHRHHPPWFLALSTRSGGTHSHSRSHSCFLHNPIDRRWRLFSLDFIPYSARPIATIGGLLLLKSTINKRVQLHICNPFTKQFRNVPLLHIRRTNPALGLVELGPSQHIGLPHFRVYAAGGMSEEIIGRASYEPTFEMYDSQHDMWTIIGSMPVEFAVRLTVWTPNESVFVNGILYWITSARAYSVMGFEIGPNKWKEFSAPMADTLEFATLVPRNGMLTLVGGTSGGGVVCIWELDDAGEWKMIKRMPSKMGMKLLGGKSSWACTKCVGIEGAVCLYRDLWSGMVVWREVVEKGKWEWFWMEGCYTIRGTLLDNCPLKGLLLHPNLSPSP